MSGLFGKKKPENSDEVSPQLSSSLDSLRSAGGTGAGDNNGTDGSVQPGVPKKTITTILLGAAALALAVSRYKICQPNQYLVRTGIGITNMSVSKKAVVWPLQKHVFVGMNPKTYTFNLHNMSKEKVEFNLPVTFTIGPIDPKDDKGMEGFVKYCQKITEATPKEIETLIAGIIEGETRGLTAKLTIEEMFNSKERFKEEVVSSIEKDLNMLGLTIFNANIKEMSDYDDRNKYFEYRKQIAIEKANYQSQADVSEAKKEGDVTMELNRRDTRIRMAQLEQEARLSENENAKSISISNADLEIIKAENLKKADIAKIESHMAAKERQAELQRAVNTKLKEQQVEFMRSESLSKAIVEAEAKERMADAQFYSERKKADAIQLTLQAQANGLKMIYESCGRNPILTQFYLGLNSGLYPELAKQSAEAVKGLNPKINIWNTGSDAEKNSDSMQSIIKMVQSFAPMLEGLQLQGGVKIPDWLPHSKVESSSSSTCDVLSTEISEKKEVPTPSQQ